MSDSDNYDDDEIFEQEEVEIGDDNAESDALEAEEEHKETLVEEQPQITIERVRSQFSVKIQECWRPNCSDIYIFK